MKSSESRGARCSAGSPSRPTRSWTWPGGSRAVRPPLPRLRSMSCSGPSSRARARPPSCSGRSDRPGRCPARQRADLRRPGRRGGNLAGDPPTWLAGPTGGLDAPVRPAAVRQAGLAARQRPGPRPGPRRGPPRASAAGGAGGCGPAGRHRTRDAAVPADRCPCRPARGLPGRAGLLLALLEVDLDRLRNAVLVELGGVRR